MKKHIYLLILLIFIVFFFFGCGNGEENGEKEKSDNNEITTEQKKNEEIYGIDSLRIATGGTGGTYFPLGGNMAHVLKEMLNLDVSAITSHASIENMKLLHKKDVQLAFTQTDIAFFAKEGSMMFEGNKVEGVQAIGSLFPEAIQIITRADSGIKRVDDLKGKTVAVGKRESGTHIQAKQILELYGISLEDIDAKYVSFDDAATGLQDETMDAAFITAGVPTGAVEGLAATTEITIIPLDDKKLESFISKYPYYVKYTIPAGTYDDIETNIDTVAVKSMLVVDKDLPNELVYDITKTIFENKEKLGHVLGENINIESVLSGLTLDIHPGAKKYYDERGITKEEKHTP